MNLTPESVLTARDQAITPCAGQIRRNVGWPNPWANDIEILYRNDGIGRLTVWTIQYLSGRTKRRGRTARRTTSWIEHWYPSVVAQTR